MRMLALLLCVLALPAAAERLDFLPIDKAVQQGVAEQKVTVIYFTAEWCGVCKTMESRSFADPQVIEAAGGFAWGKVDTDEQPQVAATFGVTALPTMLMFNAQGQLLDQRLGYLSPTQLLEWLTERQGDALQPGAMQQASMRLMVMREQVATLPQGEELDAAVLEMTQAMAQMPRGGRAATRQVLLAAGPRVWPGLGLALDSEQLATRAAAADLLKEATAAGLPFDPFAEPEDRAEQANEWQRWIALSHVLQD